MRAEFEALRAASLKQRRRCVKPDRHPYTAGHRTLHQSVCPRTREWIGGIEDESPWMRQNLREFAHAGITNGGWATHMRVLEAGEAAAWVAERIGPRGGLHYRLCRICTPALPAAG
ncbi:hypothetical protein [Streptomyces sp. NPDC088816]|uniref:hypothetical protein n=1 Tax=Streptomyces sp. NPDC088816 TaxID=3365906 RepID=UPI0038258576